jgi:Low psii accumulation1 / Rep27
MTNPTPKTPTQRARERMSPEEYKRLRAELKAPYRPLRKFIYVGCGASGLIGAFIFFFRLLAGNDVTTVFPNFALQLGVIALMVWLYRLEQKAES